VLVVLLLGAGVAVAQPKLTKPPKLTGFVAAIYPTELAPNIVASVVAAVDIGVDGKVTNAAVVTSSGYPTLDEAALVAIRQFAFEPAEVDDKPSPFRI